MTKPDELDEYNASLMDERTDTDFLAWKEAKVRGSIEQAKDRSQMIPANQVWEESYRCF